MLRLPRFAYLRPTSIDEALRMKQDAGPDGMYVAGGTDLYPNMKRRHQEPKTVVSLAAIESLRRVSVEPGVSAVIAGSSLKGAAQDKTMRAIAGPSSEWMTLTK